MIQDHLKTELEVFISNVFLGILESSNSTFEHKKLVLEVFNTFSNMPDALVQVSVIFLNVLLELVIH